MPDFGASPAQLLAPSSGAPVDLDRRFGGVARLYGKAAFARLRAAHAVVVGIGGVGSWAAEALARSGVGQLTLIDLDHVAESNVNRQVHALTDTLGQAKVAAMAARIAGIDPRARVNAVEEFVTVENAATLVPAADVVLDCIDQLAPKAALLAACRARGLAVLTSGAGGGRSDPTRIRRADLALVDGDPLLAKVRYRLRRHHGFPRAGAGRRTPKFGIEAIYSNEPVRGRGTAGAPLSCAGYGSVVTVTAALGLALAAAALDYLAAARAD
ncbi:MAG: ThiF family adenylyltransferase [Sutterellaceae bacterium]|nr:ThiF family adenylyltransferase [Burkholderiaceae bacterium]MDW8430837.1 ThiF family adenylyltransferase [Sutterellaceae bacterium]